MKIVLNSQGSLGDVRPFLALGLALRKTGFEVVICAPPNFEGLFSSNGFVFHAVGFDSQKILEDQAKDLMGNPGKSMNTVMRILQENIPDQFARLSVAVKDASLLIGSGQDFVGRSVAEHVGIPYRFVCHSPLYFKSGQLAPLGFPVPKAPVWMNRFFWSLANSMMNKNLGSITNANREKIGLKEVEGLLAYTVENSIVAADPALATIPGDVTANYFQTGYWHLEEEMELNSELNQFIEAGSPPVFIGFGSMTDPSPSKTAKILQEIIDSRRFRLIISKGWAKLGINSVNDTTFFVDYVPHARLFPRMAAVVHHGGAGTIHTAARAGVPQVIVSHMLDQFYWGGRVSSLQIGPKFIKRRQLSGKNLSSAIEEAVTNPVFKQNATRIGEILDQHDGLQDAVQYIKTIVN